MKFTLFGMFSAFLSVAVISCVKKSAVSVESVGYGDKVLLLKPANSPVIRDTRLVAESLDSNKKYEFVICKLTKDLQIKESTCKNPFTLGSEDLNVAFMNPTDLEKFRQEAKNTGFWLGILNGINEILGLTATGATVWAVYGVASTAGGVVGSAVGGPVGTVAGAVTGFIAGTTASTVAGISVRTSMGWFKAHTTERWEKANTRIDEYFDSIFLLDGGLKVRYAEKVQDIGHISRGLAHIFGAQIKQEFDGIMNGDANEFFVDTGFPQLNRSQVLQWLHTSRLELQETNEAMCHIPFATSYEQSIGQVYAADKKQKDLEDSVIKFSNQYLAEGRPSKNAISKKLLTVLTAATSTLDSLAGGVVGTADFAVKNGPAIKATLESIKASLAYSRSLGQLFSTLQLQVGDVGAIRFAAKIFPAIVVTRDRIDDVILLSTKNPVNTDKALLTIDKILSQEEAIKKSLTLIQRSAPMFATAFKVLNNAVGAYSLAMKTCDISDSLLAGMEYREQLLLKKDGLINTSSNPQLWERYCSIARKVNNGKQPTEPECNQKI